MIFISNYYAKAEEKRRDFTEKFALAVALNHKNDDSTYTTIFTDKELKEHELLKAGTYFEAYKGSDRKIINQRHTAQKEYDNWIRNGNRQARQEATSRLKFGIVVVLIIIVVVIIFWYGDRQAANNPYYWNS